MFQRWFKRNGTGASANGQYRHGNAHLIDMRQIIKTYQSAARTCKLQHYLALISRIIWRIGRPFHGFLIIQRAYEYATKRIKNYVT